MSTLFESYSHVGWGTYGNCYSDHWLSQSFTPKISHSFTSIGLYLYRTETIGTCSVEIYHSTADDEPKGIVLASVSFDDGDIPLVGDADWVSFDFSSSGITLKAGIKYIILLKALNPPRGILWWRQSGTNEYTRGTAEISSNAGVTWIPCTYDFWFKDYGEASFSSTLSTVIVGRRDPVAQADVWAFDSSGNLLWIYDTGGDYLNKVVLDNSKNVYIVGLAADNGDGNGTRNFWKLDSNGNYINGMYIASAISVVDLDFDSSYNIYVASTNGSYKILADLSTITLIQGSVGFGSSVIAVNRSDGSIYVGSGGFLSDVYKYNSSLVVQWQVKPVSGVTCQALCILSNGDIIAGIARNAYYYKADGSSPVAGEWTTPLLSGGAVISSCVEDSNHNLYFTLKNIGGLAPDNRFFCLDINGVERWSAKVAGSVYDSVINNFDEIYTIGDIFSGFADSINKVDIVNHTVKGIGYIGNDFGHGVAIVSSSTILSTKKVNLSDDCYGHYQLNDNLDSIVVIDSSDKENDGVASRNTNLLSVPGKINQAFEFDEFVSDDVLCGDIDEINLYPYQDIGMAFWVKFPSDFTGIRTIMCKYNSITNLGFYIYARLTTKVGIFANLSTGWAAETGYILDFDTWYFVVIGYNRSDHISINVNNGLVLELNFYAKTAEASDLSNLQDFAIGKLNGETGYLYFDGILDNVIVLNRLITAPEANYLWNDGDGRENNIQPIPTPQSWKLFDLNVDESRGT